MDAATKLTNYFAALPIDIRDRFSSVQQAGYQVSAIAELMRGPIGKMRMAETHTEMVALSLFLDRLTELGETIAILGDGEENSADASDSLIFATDRA